MGAFTAISLTSSGPTVQVPEVQKKYFLSDWETM